MKKIKFTDLLIFILSAELIGSLSALISGGSFGSYYDSLVRPPLAPPGWLFPAVWALLYALMGIGAYLISETDDIEKQPALTLYLVQLCANALWSPVFFGLRSFGGAVITVAVMLVLIICMLAVFRRIRKSAALLNLPYLAWTIYAAYLTIGFYILNK